MLTFASLKLFIAGTYRGFKWTLSLKLRMKLAFRKMLTRVWWPFMHTDIRNGTFY